MSAVAKKILVFGGTGSIGSAICKTLAREGAKTAFTYHQNETGARTLAQDVSAAGFMSCDFNDPRGITLAVTELTQKLGGLDGLICAVGFPGKHFDLELTDLTPEEIDSCFYINARGTLLACQAAANQMGKTQPGNFVILGSMDGIKTVPSPIHFATSKSALKGMVESMSKELGDFDIKVNLLVPGVVEGGASLRLTEDLKKEYLKHCSMKRFAKPGEIAEVATWFALENTYVTGQAIVLNGGL